MNAAFRNMKTNKTAPLLKSAGLSCDCNIPLIE